MSLFRGLCLSGGCVVSEGKKGLGLKLFKSRVEKSKMSNTFVIALTIIGDHRQTWRICWGIQVTWGALYEPQTVVIRWRQILVSTQIATYCLEK